ncbi:hypothetical protein PMZ80_004901 [Knufia obscura]|uniref:Uncharacterized protein n=2 Tax=Knufia TaxID=430999 RepID=A0AAN8EDM9_9EURO|nr:hypothetical protein PMZ80_004901 [Knufia obscura]KAK5948983.1 hypothetical protein OHC33_010069 [Knufia fluminis]
MNFPPRVTQPDFDRPGFIGLTTNNAKTTSDENEGSTGCKPLSSAQPGAVSRDPVDGRIMLDVLVRCVLDEICATPTYRLPKNGWSLYELVTWVSEWYAPQTYMFAMPEREKYLLVQELSTEPKYENQTVELIGYSGAAAEKRFDKWIERSHSGGRSPILQIEIHFRPLLNKSRGNKEMRREMRKTVWGDGDLDCWIEEEAALDYEDGMIWTPKDNVQGQEVEMVLKELSVEEQTALEAKMAVKQPSTEKWFPERKPIKK